MERALGLMCGAGPLPARMAREARRQGWRVTAFAFGDTAALEPHADRTIPSRLSEVGEVLAALGRDRISAVLFSGGFSMRQVLTTEPGSTDAAAQALGDRAGSLVAADLVQAVIGTVEGLGIEVLDQRPFLGDWVDGQGCWSTRQPSEAEWVDVRRGLTLARLLADAQVGQTIVLKRGAVVAVEAVEGTTEAIRRGTMLGGADTVIVKAVARGHDYRFDTPAVGLDTVAAARAGRASVLAVEAGRVVVVDREATLRAADDAGLAMVGVA